MLLFYLMSYVFVNELLPTSFGKPLEIPSSTYKNRNLPFPHKEDKQASASVLQCDTKQLDVNDVRILQNGDVFIKALNETIPAERAHIVDDAVHICYPSNEDLQKQSFEDCEKWPYDEDEYTILPNGSVLLNDEVLEKGTYEFKNGQLITCALDEDYTTHNSSETGHLPFGPSVQDEVSIYIGKVGGSISIIALAVHLLIFLLVPALRNLHGYNLASLSVAFVFGYSFMLIGQIAEVLGVACVISGVLQLNFFLAAFFCMNVIAFDIWKTLKLATQKLIISSTNVKKRQFAWYTLYAWGCPLIITIACIVSDNVENVPDKMKPYFGKDDECWITNNFAKTVFFTAPAFTLFVLNGIFFILSAFMIKNNTMKNTNDQHKQTARLNFFLYLRLGLMMGVTWIIGVIATVAESKVLWLIFAVPNSLQGLFVFLMFTCSKKVLKSLQEKSSTTNSKSTSTDKQSANSTKL